jgi:hypothetical protein
LLVTLVLLVVLVLVIDLSNLNAETMGAYS